MSAWKFVRQSSIHFVGKIFQNANFRVIGDLERCESYQNFKVPTMNGAPISIATTSVCPKFLSFLIRNLFKAKQCCPTIKHNYAILEHSRCHVLQAADPICESHLLSGLRVTTQTLCSVWNILPPYSYCENPSHTAKYQTTVLLSTSQNAPLHLCFYWSFPWRRPSTYCFCLAY